MVFITYWVYLSTPLIVKKDDPTLTLNHQTMSVIKLLDEYRTFTEILKRSKADYNSSKVIDE
ncbi:hypothetical protein [Bacillus sp. B15-48]|uniref:hypothetical protein n=1 Tax=Bacillus sp. B15-48 TaxID=1548601 RepID=UPI00193FF591|nr:hypothetical protein [Bacillus sp. B15-48]MBM4764779.1 hypothetical protein [Bacillus sp. B15-48]